MSGDHAGARSGLAFLIGLRSDGLQAAMEVVLEHLFLSPGHNYFGRHGQEAGGHELVACEELKLHAGRGIAGDRFFDWKPDYKGQITFFDAAVADEILAHAGNPEAGPGAFRRNVVMRGVDLNKLIGVTFEVQGIRFQGIEECRPCYWMDQACGAEGIEDLMKGRGGLRCRILDDGVLRRGIAECRVISE